MVVAASWSLSSSLTSTKVFSPVSKRGWLTLSKVGMKKLPIKLAARSVISLTLVTVALAPLEDPTSVAPVSRYPPY